MGVRGRGCEGGEGKGEGGKNRIIIPFISHHLFLFFPFPLSSFLLLPPLLSAIQSGDTDLVYLAILQIKRSRSPEDFMKIIRNKHVALSLVIKYCKQQVKWRERRGREGKRENELRIKNFEL